MSSIDWLISSRAFASGTTPYLIDSTHISAQFNVIDAAAAALCVSVQVKQGASPVYSNIKGTNSGLTGCGGSAPKDEFGRADAEQISKMVQDFTAAYNAKDVEKIVETVKLVAPAFGGINLEDIAAPRCFDIEERLRKELDIPVFHDDQHGTAVVVLAALLNALFGKREHLRARIAGIAHFVAACHWARMLRNSLDPVSHIHSQWAHSCGTIAMLRKKEVPGMVVRVSA